MVKVVFNLHVLVVNEVEHYFMYLLAMCISCPIS